MPWSEVIDLTMPNYPRARVRKSYGVCPNDGNDRDNAFSLYCSKCRKSSVRASKRRRNKLIAKGLCPECNGKEPIVRGKRAGANCAKRLANLALTTRHTRVAAGLCRRCGKVPVVKKEDGGKFTNCRGCRIIISGEKLRRRNAKKISSAVHT